MISAENFKHTSSLTVVVWISERANADVVHACATVDTGWIAGSGCKDEKGAKSWEINVTCIRVMISGVSHTLPVKPEGHWHRMQSIVVGSSKHIPPFSQVRKLQELPEMKIEAVKCLSLMLGWLPFGLAHWSTRFCREDWESWALVWRKRRERKRNEIREILGDIIVSLQWIVDHGTLMRQ